MLYLFSGDDTKNKNLAYEKFMKSMPSSTDIFFISRNEFNPMQIESFYSGSSLFSALSGVVFQNIFEHEETRNFVSDKLKLMVESANSFIFLEGKLDKPATEAFKKALPDRSQTAPFINTFELPKEKKEKFDNFLLANAFGEKNKLNLWIYFRQAVDKGVVMEELIGVLFWKIKDMILKKKFDKFSKKELKDSASRLSYLLPQARKAGLDPETAFEQFLLEAF